MLTIKQINEVSFGKAGFSGYKPEDVDIFIDEVADSFQQLIAEKDAAAKKAAELTAKNSELQEKLSILAEKLESYRKDEDGIKDAIISAQRISKVSINEAKEKAESIVADAEIRAKKVIDDAKRDSAKAYREYARQTDSKKNELEEIKKQVNAFRASLLEMYKKHLDCINHIPSFPVKSNEVESEPIEEPEEVPYDTYGISQEADTDEPVTETLKSEPKQERHEINNTRNKNENIRMNKPRPNSNNTDSRNRGSAANSANRQHRTNAKQNAGLNRKVDYSREQDDTYETISIGEDNDLSGIGIDTKAYRDIPQTLLDEKKKHFSNLEFGDGIDVTNHK